MPQSKPVLNKDIAAKVQTIAGIGQEDFWVYIQDIPVTQVVEFGRITRTRRRGFLVRGDVRAETARPEGNRRHLIDFLFLRILDCTEAGSPSQEGRSG